MKTIAINIEVSDSEYLELVSMADKLDLELESYLADALRNKLDLCEV